MEDEILTPSYDETSIEQSDVQAEKSAEPEAKWYVLHTYSGYENMVRDNLRMVFEKNNMTDRLKEITIPMEDVVEEKNGKRKIVQRRMFPCYVLVKMIYNNDMWHMITNTRGVTGFVGPQGRPLPLNEDEIRRMHLEKIVVETDYKVGDRVKVTQGPLEGFVGEIETMDAAASKCRVIVSMFGRETPVDLELYQIERAE
ncbi:MAG: transcription termination/antitermination protein NusG [Clostridiales bacterium]|nr:transcription termination/antitermination protein NusG [Clostridiales bacterium]